MTKKLDYPNIREGRMLHDDDIDYFAYLLHSNFRFVVRECWYVQCPELIEPLNPHENHIQILHSCEGEYEHGKFSNGHWICSYYDTKNIYIFDSIRSNKLHEKHRLFLSQCYTNFPFESKIIFPKVQVQPNGIDCGVYAIAFATSLVLGEWPIEKSFRYDHNQMRLHLLQIFQSRIISNFPKEMSVSDDRTEKKSKRKCNDCDNVKATSVQKRFKSKIIINDYYIT